ncbi:GNAT family N-acetyltransferase [Aquimarina litoralis]|uniref:GNAT family N-acetyltransferase n=1 Tax=Aquimarina litoralis TaxID=584605 RepID=UPI001C55E874|nr:GNAT family protein [Aquimarina litoralis]MBW1298024.1 GNAT family N-acetyltransferase [Aquimarina litoralis]
MNQEVLLRPLELSDKSVLAKLANNKKIWDNLRDYIPFPYNDEDADFFINQTQQENPQQNFAITFNGELCGVIGVILQQDVYRKSAEIGYWIGEPFWGNGIASQAVRLITEYGFNSLDLQRIYAGIFEFNIASMKVLEKNGFEEEGIFKNAIFKNGKLYNEHRFYRLKSI